jgi:hypothetical protein
MSMPLLPQWLQVLWVLALCIGVMLHLRHAWPMQGQARWWHVAHIAMASGMVARYLLQQAQHASLYWSGVVVFAVLAAAMVAVGIVLRRRGGLLNWLRAGAAVDTLAMADMALPAGDRPVSLTYLVVTYLVVEVQVWLSNPLPGSRR